MKYLIDSISCNTPGYENLINVVVPRPVPLTIVVLTFENQRVFVIGIEVCRAWIRSKGEESNTYSSQIDYGWH